MRCRAMALHLQGAPVNRPSESILELIDLEHRRSSTRRVMSVAGLVIGGGLLGAGIVLLTTMARRRWGATSMLKASALAPSAHAMPPSYGGPAATPANGDASRA